MPSAALEPIDLGFRGLERAIGVYLVETNDGLALFDCGPSSTLPGLRSGLAARGLELRDVRHLLLSHIHLDHAGAAGAIVREHPELRVWVSERGARHLVDPTKLEASARRLYGDRFDSLFGELIPVPESNLSLAAGDVLGWEAFAAPGHALTTTSATSAKARCSQVTRAGCAARLRQRCCRSRRRRTSTSSCGTKRSTGSRSAHPHGSR